MADEDKTENRVKLPWLSILGYSVAAAAVAVIIKIFF